MDVQKKEKQMANRSMKRRVTSPVIKEMQVKTTMSPSPQSDWQLLKGLITVVLGKGARAHALFHAHAKRTELVKLLSIPVTAGYALATPKDAGVRSFTAYDVPSQ